MSFDCVFVYKRTPTGPRKKHSTVYRKRLMTCIYIVLLCINIRSPHSVEHPPVSIYIYFIQYPHAAKLPRKPQPPNSDHTCDPFVTFISLTSFSKLPFTCPFPNPFPFIIVPLFLLNPASD